MFPNTHTGKHNMPINYHHFTPQIAHHHLHPLSNHQHHIHPTSIIPSVNGINKEENVADS